VPREEDESRVCGDVIILFNRRIDLNRHFESKRIEEYVELFGNQKDRCLTARFVVLLVLNTGMLARRFGPELLVTVPAEVIPRETSAV